MAQHLQIPLPTNISRSPRRPASTLEELEGTARQLFYTHRFDFGRRQQAQQQS